MGVARGTSPGRRCIWSKALAGLVWRRPDLLHLNVAGRGSTLAQAVAERACRALADRERRAPPRLRLRCRSGTAPGLAASPDRLDVPPGPAGHRARRKGSRRPCRTRSACRRRGSSSCTTPCRTQGRRRSDAAAPALCGCVFLGHLDDRKGVPELLEALSGEELRKRDWRLVLAGGGELATVSRG